MNRKNRRLVAISLPLLAAVLLVMVLPVRTDAAAVHSTARLLAR